MKALNILFIEEHKDHVHDMVRRLNEGGFDLNYHHVNDQPGLLDSLNKKSWDLVISDYDLSSCNAYELLKTVRQFDLQLPFIIVSSDLAEDAVIGATHAGANDFITRNQLARLVPIVTREQRDAEQRKARQVAEEQLLYNTNHDSLTGLINRQEFELRLERAVGAIEIENRHHALLYFDLDQFKVINDTCGHIAGDELLRQLVVILKESIRESDTLARLGGDEFGILLENCSPEQAQRVANNLIDKVRGFRYYWLDMTFEPSASIGLVNIENSKQSVTQLLSNADLACFAAKDGGRNRIHTYDEGNTDTARHSGEMQWVSNLTKALDNDRFRLFHQEIFSLTNDGSKSRHFEILIRMLDENDKIIAPGAFVPAAERFNLMPAIDRWVISKLFSNIHRLNPGVPCRTHTIYSINISGNSLNDPLLLNFIREQTERTEINAEYVCFEITETAAISNISHAVNFIKELKALGFLFSLDDFGSGLSSFTYLKNLPVDYLKIDGSFVRGIADDLIDRAMVEAINKIGQVMGLQTIAEFVEDEFILQQLRELGIDWAQGYAIHKPELLKGVEYL